MKQENELEIASKYIGKSSVFFIVGYPLTFIIGIVIARKVGATNIGLVSLYLSFMQILTFISLFGTERGSIKYISRFLGIKKYNNINKVITFSLVFPLFTMCLILGFYFLFETKILLLLFPNTPQISQVLKVFIFFLPVFVYKQSLIGILRGLQRPHIDRFNQSIIYPIFRLVLLMLFVLFIGLLHSLLLATILSITIGVFFMFFKLKNETKILFNLTNDKSTSINLKEYLYFSLPLVLVPIINVAVSNVDTLLMSQYLEVKNIGIYSVVKKFGLLISVPLSLASPMIASSVSKMYSQDKMGDFRSLYIFVTKWSVFASSILFCVIFNYSKDILLLMGNEFSEGEIALKIFAFSQFLVVLIGPIGNVLIMTNRKSYFLIYSYLSVLIGFVSIFYLTPVLGIIGSVISLSSIFLITNLLCLITLISKFKIFPMALKHFINRIAILGLVIGLHKILFIENGFFANNSFLSLILGSLFITVNISLYFFYVERFSVQDQFIINKLKKKYLKK